VRAPLFRYFFAAWELPSLTLCNHKCSRFRLTQFSTELYEIGLFFHMFISLMPGDSFERKGSSKNNNAIWKTYHWLKILQASKIKTKNQFQGYCQSSSWVRSLSVGRINFIECMNLPTDKGLGRNKMFRCWKYSFRDAGLVGRINFIALF